MRRDRRPAESGKRAPRNSPCRRAATPRNDDRLSTPDTPCPFPWRRASAPKCRRSTPPADRDRASRRWRERSYERGSFLTLLLICLPLRGRTFRFFARQRTDDVDHGGAVAIRQSHRDKAIEQFGGAIEERRRHPDAVGKLADHLDVMLQA